MNNVNLVGNVVRDLELKSYSNNNGEGVYANFSLAVNEYSTNKKEKVTNFIDVVAFDKKAEVLSKYISKGSKIAIQGKLRTDSYTKSNGEKRYSVQVVLTDFTFLNNKKVVNGESGIDEGNIPF